MKIECEKNYGLPVLNGIVTVEKSKATWKNIAKYRFRMINLWIKRTLGLLK